MCVRKRECVCVSFFVEDRVRATYKIMCFQRLPLKNKNACNVYIKNANFISINSYLFVLYAFLVVLP
jgi:hypothetical protein